MSILFGVCVGAFYDVFRVIRIARKPRGAAWSSHRILRYADAVLCFCGDMLFWLTVAVAYCVFIYDAADGRLRIASLVAALLGAAAWYFSFGRLVVFAADKIIGFFRAAFRFILKITLFPIVRLLVFAATTAGGMLGRSFGALYGRIKYRRELSAADKGFGLYRTYRRKRKRK